MTRLATSLLGRPLASPLMNASGVWCSTADELDALLAAGAGAVVTKSATLEPRAGNPEPRYRATRLGSINSMGLPNAGYRYYLDWARAHAAGPTPVLVSVAGLTVDDNLAMLAAVRDADLAAPVELNLSCPNVPGKPQLAYDLEALDATLAAVTAEHDRPFGLKLPPYLDLVHFDEAAAVLNRYPQVAFLTCINSIGNGLLIDTESESVLIRPKGGFGGIGGDYVLPTALANVRAFAQRCPDKQIVGCGGVRTGEQVFWHLLAGATAVQLGTALHEEGPGIFTRLEAELAALLERKGYATVDDARGRLRTL